MWVKNPKRGKGRYQADLKRKDLYAFFIKKYPALKHISEKQYNAVIDEYVSLSIDSILNGKVLDTPIGRIFIQKMKMPFSFLKQKEHLKLDFKKSMELKKHVYFTNDHSGNFRMQITWKRPYLFKKNLYSFLATRDFKRGIGFKLKSLGSTDYIIKFIRKYQG